MLARPFRVFYRLVQTDPPSIEDFMSHEALGILPTRPLSGRAHDWWQGVSHHDSRDAAMAKGNASPWLGLYVAELHVPTAAIVRVEQTGRDPTHHTIWAHPAALLSWVVSVQALEPLH